MSDAALRNIVIVALAEEKGLLKGKRKIDPHLYGGGSILRLQTTA